MIRVVVAAACGLVLSGCATGKIDSRYAWPTAPAAPASKAGGAPLRQMQVDVADLIKARLRASRTETADAITADYDAGTVSTSKSPLDPGLDQLIAAVRDSTDSVAIRNDVTSAWMAASTANCMVYVQALRGGQVDSRLISDLFAGSLATAASLAAPVRTAKLLSGLSAFSIAEGASVDRNIFAQQGAELVADAIVQLRAEDRARIEAKLKLSYDEWPMALAITDLEEFHGDCTMLRGFSKMRDALTAREQTVQAIREAASGVARSGGGADQMMAVLAILQSGKGAAPPASPDPPPTWDKDLVKLKTAAEPSIQAGMTALQNAQKAGKDLTKDADVTAALANTFGAKGGYPVDATWPHGFNGFAQTAVKEQAIALKKAIEDGDAAVKAATSADDKTKAASAETTAIAAVTASALKSDRAAAELFRQVTANVRQIVFAQLAAFTAGTPAQVVTVMTNAQKVGSPGDPVLAAGLADAKDSAAVAKDDGALAARRAVAAGKAVVG